MPGLDRLGGGIDQPEIDDLDARTRQFAGHGLDIAFKAILQPVELGPIGVQSDAEQANAEWPISGLGKIAQLHATSPILLPRLCRNGALGAVIQKLTLDMRVALDWGAQSR